VIHTVLGSDGSSSVTKTVTTGVIARAVNRAIYSSTVGMYIAVGLDAYITTSPDGINL
jgi:hypothetical protein